MSQTTAVTQEEIIRALSTALISRTSMQLHNIFRGVPVNFPALVTSVDRDTVVLKVHRLQSVVISVEKRTFIKSATFPDFIRAFPKTVNFNTQEVVLTQFSSTGKAFTERAHIRVQFEEPINVGILNEDGLTLGTLTDISKSCPGVFVFGAYIPEKILVNLEGNTRVCLDFSLPGIDQIIHLVGTITNLSLRKGAVMTRIGIQTSPAQSMETALMKYIDRRQVEILDELQRIYHRACNLKQA